MARVEIVERIVAEPIDKKYFARRLYRMSGTKEVALSIEPRGAIEWELALWEGGGGDGETDQTA